MTTYRLTVQTVAGQNRITRPDEPLDGRTWRLSWWWSSVDDAWFLDITNDAGESFYGLPVSAGLDILHPYRASDVPPGEITVRTTTGRAPAKDDFAEGRAVAYYIGATT